MAMPLLFVVALSMIKDAYEDYKRHKADKGENLARTEVYDKEMCKFVQREWRHIGVGDLVRVRENCFFPADMIVINSSEPEGALYVETKNLDGESNLKLKSVAKDLIARYEQIESFEDLSGVTLNVEEPNNRIYKFDGNFAIRYRQMGQSGMSFSTAVTNERVTEIPLSNDNVVLRGMSLRNTEHVTGLIVYTGHDSKIQMNSTGAVYKTSNISQITNRQIWIVCLMQVLASAIGSIIGSTWTVKNVQQAVYLGIDKEDKWNSTWGLLFIQKTGTWILIFTNFVPISLIVTLEIVKFWQGTFMSWDFNMYDEDEDFAMQAQTTNINEELGQIEYIFSDKTGTLTCNVMKFRKYSHRSGTVVVQNDQLIGRRDSIRQMREEKKEVNVPLQSELDTPEICQPGKA